MERLPLLAVRTVVLAAVFAAAVSLAPGGYALAQSPWEWQNPLPTGNGLHAGRFIGPAACIAVGENATVLRTTDLGTHWTALTSAAGGTLALFAFDFADSAVGIAVGDSGFALKTGDGGMSWIRLYAGPAVQLRGVDMIDRPRAVAVGTEGKILRTSDGGTLWFEQTLPSGAFLNDVAFAGADIGIAVGDVGTIARTSDGGLTWATVSPTTFHLRAVSWMNADTVVAIGGNQADLITGKTEGVVLRSTDAGLTWDVRYPPETPGLSDVTVRKDGSGFCLSDVDASNRRHAILRTDDAGLTWTRVFEFPEASSVSDIAFDDMVSGLAVGGNSLFTTTDGAQSWLSRLQDSARTQLTAVAMASPQVWYVAGGHEDLYAVALATTDEGSTWVRRAVGYSPASILRSISAPDESTAFAVGDYGLNVFKTTNRGGNWAEHATGFDRYWYGVSFCDAQTGTVVGTSGTILRTTDGGGDFAWVQQSSGTAEHLWDVAQLSPDVAWVVGAGGTILRTSNGGATWTPQSSGTSATVRSISALSQTGAFALTGDRALLWTTDGGETWGSRPIAAPHGVMLMDLKATGGDSVTVVGSGGTILRTTDAGVNWTISPSGTSDQLWSVDFLPGTGIGTVVGYAGTILRTTTGGITWVREESAQRIPRSFLLEQNYPNPFNPVTVVRFTLVERQWTSVRVYDLLGRAAATLVNEMMEPGTHEVRFDASGLASGVYLCRMQAGAFAQTRRMLLIQ